MFREVNAVADAMANLGHEIRIIVFGLDVAY